mmetsp:Transcript_17262/g.43022  ORF Transcript_17262/g.43022 Transcript_17262/m.43022 type:complete len:82 (+) Transcript_17262:1016-1261(+)
MSTSSTPTFFPSIAIVVASCAVTVLLPTPPLPDSTSILCFTSDSALYSPAAAMVLPCCLFQQYFACLSFLFLPVYTQYLSG